MQKKKSGKVGLNVKTPINGSNAPKNENTIAGGPNQNSERLKHMEATLKEYGMNLGIPALLVQAAIFAIVDVIAKYLTETHLSVFSILFFRNLVQVICAMIRLRWEHEPVWGKENHLFLFARGAFYAVGLMLLYYTFQVLPLTIASLINFTDVIWTAIFAACFLQENVGRWTIVAVMVCVSGTVFITQPEILFPKMDGSTVIRHYHNPKPETYRSNEDGDSYMFGIICGILSSVLFGGANVLMRKIRTSERTDVILLYASIIVVALSVGPFAYGCIWLNEDGNASHYIPNCLWEWILCTGIGFLSYIGQWFLTYGFQTTPGVIASVISYVQLLMVVVLAMIIFHEWPNIYSWIGCVCVVLSTIIVFLDSNKGKKGKFGIYYESIPDQNDPFPEDDEDDKENASNP